MGVVFRRGQELGRGDLDIFLTDDSGNSANAAEITFSIYYVDASGAEALIGNLNRLPANPALGEYYAPLLVPAVAQLGTYRIRWRFRRNLTSPFHTVVQEWAVVAETTVDVPTQFSQSEFEMIARLRVLLRDNNSARNYRFMPPTHEGDVNAYNQVFGFVWEDAELLEYLRTGLDWWNSFPPETEGLRTLDLLVGSKPTWRTAVLWAAIVHAMFALTLNWSHERFSLDGCSVVSVFVDGKKIELTIKELYDIVYG